MSCFCTIITQSHLPYAKTLFDSLKEHGESPVFYVLVTDANDFQLYDNLQFKIIYLNEIADQNLVKKLSQKYGINSNEFRWSMKPVLLLHLLQSGDFSQVFFLDPDLCFFSDYSFLCDELGENSFLLSPHWNTMDPNIDEEEFFKLFTDGIYNGGFLGATIKGLETLKWWANSCLFCCEKNKYRALYDDQSYLELFPVRNPDTKILSHKGCNIAVWNTNECKRILQNDGTIMINNQFPIVFIHFTDIPTMLTKDILLKSYLDFYCNKLLENNYKLNIIEQANRYLIRKKSRELKLYDRIIRKIKIIVNRN